MSACSAHAEADTSPFLRACQCSFSQCFWDLPVYPMYTFGHTVQEMELTTPRQRGAETINHSDFAVHQQSMERNQTSPHTIRHPGGVSSTDGPSSTAGSPKAQYQWTKESPWSARARVLVHKTGWGSHSPSVFKISPSLLAPVPHWRMTKLLLGHLGRPTCHLTLPPL